MKHNLNLEEIKQKICIKLEPSGWAKILKPYIFSGDFDKAILTLAELSESGKRFTPPLKDIFRAFEECPYKDLSIVIVGQDPYPGLEIADGIAFSCSKTMQLQPSLRYILDEINRSVYRGHGESTNVNLVRWSNQGILMLNTALTTEVNNIGQHYDIWKSFTAYLFDYLSTNDTGLIYIFMGKKAQEWSEYINDNLNYKFNVTHPASAAYSKLKAWDSKEVFIKARDIVKENYNKQIIW